MEGYLEYPWKHSNIGRSTMVTMKVTMTVTMKMTTKIGGRAVGAVVSCNTYSF